MPAQFSELVSKLPEANRGLLRKLVCHTVVFRVLLSYVSFKVQVLGAVVDNPGTHMDAKKLAGCLSQCLARKV